MSLNNALNRGQQSAAYKVIHSLYKKNSVKCIYLLKEIIYNRLVSLINIYKSN